MNKYGNFTVLSTLNKSVFDRTNFTFNNFIRKAKS